MAFIDQLENLLKSSPPSGWQLEDFAGLDQLHAGGLAATKQLITWLPKPKQEVPMLGLSKRDKSNHPTLH